MSERRAVRHLVKGLGPGGAERLLVAQIRSDRSAARHEVAYLVEQKSHLVPELAELGVEARCLCVGLGIGGWISMVRRLRRLLLDDPTDIVHVHSPAVASIVRSITKTIPRRVRPVVVGTEHNRWPRHRRLTRFANRATIRFEKATIAVSDDVASTIQGTRPSQVRTIEHGIDLESVRAQANREAARSDMGADPGDVVVICVANLRREKSLDVLVEAARCALADAPELRFVSVGQGPLADDLDRWIADAGIGDRFTALGYRRDVSRLLSGADIFTLSSRHEGLPVAMMEALAVGLPVVATAAGGLPDAVGDAGTIVAVNDIEGLANAYVQMAVDITRRAELAELARIRSERYSVTRAVAEINAVYESALSGSR